MTSSYRIYTKMSEYVVFIHIQFCCEYEVICIIWTKVTSINVIFNFNMERYRKIVSTPGKSPITFVVGMMGTPNFHKMRKIEVKKEVKKLGVRSGPILSFSSRKSESKTTVPQILGFLGVKWRHYDQLNFPDMYEFDKIAFRQVFCMSAKWFSHNCSFYVQERVFLGWNIDLYISAFNFQVTWRHSDVTRGVMLFRPRTKRFLGADTRSFRLMYNM